MAGDWIKMRVSLVTHPRVIALSEAISYNADYQDWSGLHGFVPAIGGTKEEYDADLSQSLRVTRYVVVTALLKFWGYANEHVKDEFIPNLRIADLDEITSVPGFGAALEQIGWAIYDAERRGISLPNFNEHNSVASDRTAAERQKRYRDNKKREAESNGVTGDVTRNGNSNDREEKRREEKNKTKTTPANFVRFWGAYPKKASKGRALKAFNAIKPDEQLLGVMLSAIERAKTSEKWTKEGGTYIPNPATWLNDLGWEDQAPEKPKSERTWSDIVALGASVGLRESDFPHAPAFKAAVLERMPA